MSYSSIRLHIKYIKWMEDDASAEELEATETTKAGDDRLHDVEEGVDGLGEATGRGALLGLLEKRLEGGCNLLEGYRGQQLSGNDRHFQSGKYRGQ